MIILLNIVLGFLVGYVAGLKRNRVPATVYMLVAFLGSFIGTMLSLGDSRVFIEYSFVNIWSISILFSILFACVVLQYDKGGIKKAVVPILIIFVIVIGLIMLDGEPSDNSGLFREKLFSIGIEKAGQPIEGFDAYLLKQAFPGILDEDFDGAESWEGIYSYDGSDLAYKRTKSQPVTSAEQTLSNEGIETLYKNLLKRFPNQTIDELIVSISGPDIINEEHFTVGGERWISYTDKEVGLYFEYRQSPFGYIMTNPNNHLAVKSFVLHSVEDFRNQQENSEGLPTINIEVFNPGPNVTPNDWIASYEQSNYVTGSALEETQIENNVAITYEWEGLYKGETAVVARKGWVYTVSVMYLGKDSQIYKDFEQLVLSLKILVIN